MLFLFLHQAAAMVLHGIVWTNASPAQRALQSKYPGLQKYSNNEIDQVGIAYQLNCSR
jgi:hypothetical protein